MKKSMVYTLMVLALLLTCTIGIAGTSSDAPNKQEQVPATEHRDTPSPATLLLFGSSMACLLSFTKLSNQ